MTNGELVVKQAQKYLGVMETFGTNTGPFIDGWQSRWGLRGEPWCGMFADAMYAEAGVDDSHICHPATAEMCIRARREDAVWSGFGTIPPGSLWIKCGIHTAIVVKDHGNGSLTTIDGNSNNRVKYNLRPVRGTGIMIAIPKSVAQDAPPEFKIITKYYIEDLAAKPYIYRTAAGLVPRWSTRGKAEAQIAKLLAANPNKWRPRNPRAVKLGGKGFGIQLGDHRNYGAYPEPNAMKRRDAHYKKLVARNGAHYRKYSKQFKEKA